MKTFNTIINPILWGNSIALTWAWGLGLFFSVQIAIQFGFGALLDFATIDALGLVIFGAVNQFIANKIKDPAKFEADFLDKAKNFKFALLFYQFLAITMTLYACLKYITLPLGILSFLVCIMFIGAVIFMGEEFPISRIKYSHAAYGVVIFICLGLILNSNLFLSESLISTALLPSTSGLIAQFSLNNEHLSWINALWAYKPLYQFNSNFDMLMLAIPFVLGFITGPWLDIQNWQRVHQINKENSSILVSYLWSGIIFWLIIVFSGIIALACFIYAQDHAPDLIAGLSNLEPTSLLYSVKTIITKVFSAGLGFNNLLGLYLIFIALAVLSTFDSGYIAYRWYVDSLVKDSKSIVFSFLPTKFVSSPILWFVLTSIAATTTLHFSEFGKFISKFDPQLERFFRFELEYYIGFFASFFLIYAVCFYRNIISQKLEVFSALKLFATALASIAIFGIGYFSENLLVMAFASLLPVVYGIYAKATELELSPAESSKSEPKLISGTALNIPNPILSPIERTNLPIGASPVSIKGCYLLDGWFVHEFIPTYQDTNSVGNVYFAMYAMWVGKTRELFFLHAMPGFDPRYSEFLILTRSFEHKFLKEIREFQPVTIQVRIGEYNRKFVTLEHRILDADGDLVGKGKQVLMFVESKAYGLIDLPPDVQKSFIGFVGQK